MANAPKKKTEEATTATPAPIRRDVGHPLMNLRTEMDRLFDRFSVGFPSFSTGRDLFDWEPFRRSGDEFGIAAPHVDVSESDNGYEVVADLPGMDEKDINVELKDDVLILSGEKKEERQEKEKDYHVSERRFGSFRRSFQLRSQVDQNKTSATFKNGVLTITLPKTAEAQKKSRKIDIKTK